MSDTRLDCVVIGYNESPFDEYEGLLKSYGEDSEAYRDLKYSFVNLDGEKLNYVGLLNRAQRLARRGGGGAAAGADEFKSCDIPNLAAAYLTHFLRRRGFDACYVNLFQEEKEKLARLLAKDPLCVAITTTLYVVNFPVNEIVRFIREHNPRVKIVVGGPLIANHERNYRGDAFRAVLEDLGADIYVIEGQGELTLAQLVTSLRAGEDLAGVPNLAYFERGELRRTPKFPENNSLDENRIDWLSFSEDLGPTLQTRTARSCAFKCSFCNYPTRAGKLTLSDLGSVEQELDSMRARGNVRNVVFIDDTFNVPLPRFKDLCRLMIRKGYGFNWFSYFRCSNSDEEAIALMAESGCKGVFLGIESGSPTILTNMNKAATIEKYAKGIELLHRHGVLTFASLIVGFPGETRETVDETIAFLQASRPQYYRAQLWYCEPGTPIEMQREKYGIDGEGFVWSHRTMDSLEAMDHIDRMFLTVRDSLWLPQWSFDFWTIPYLIGKGLGFGQFRELMYWAQKLLALEIAAVPPREKRARQQEYVERMAHAFSGAGVEEYQAA